MAEPRNNYFQTPSTGKQSHCGMREGGGAEEEGRKKGGGESEHLVQQRTRELEL